MSRCCRAKAANSSFSSARIREQRTPILTSLAPVFLFLGRQLELDRVALDDFQLGAAIGAGHDLTLFDVGGLDRHRGVLARAAAAEVAPTDDDVARLDARSEVRTRFDEAGLAQRRRIRRDVVPARDDGIRGDRIAKLEDPGHQPRLLGSAIAPASAEAAATAGLAR